MPSLSNFTTEELRDATRLRNVDRYENLSRQKLVNIFTTASASTMIFRLRPRPRP